VKFYFQKLPLRKDGEVTTAWLNPPIKPLLRVYMFNVTNSRGFLEGEKPKLQEVGPFVYE
jgi:scavenger receptor class B protein 1